MLPVVVRFLAVWLVIVKFSAVMLAIVRLFIAGLKHGLQDGIVDPRSRWESPKEQRTVSEGRGGGGG